jgi:hypothetical protein
MADRDNRLVFVSYRREDSSFSAQWIAQGIRETFGPASLFIDVDAIRIGDRYARQIEQALEATDILLVLIGPHWLRLTDEFGRRRIDRTDDWVRNEIVYALSNQRRVLPILISGAKLPLKEALPETLWPLVEFQAIEFADDKRDSCLQRILARLDGLGFVRVAPEAGPPLRAASEIVAKDQFDALKKVASQGYRARNLARALKKQAIETKPNVDDLRELRDRQVELTNLLYEERALLPNAEYLVMHKLTNDFVEFIAEIDVVRRNASASTVNPGDDALAAVRAHYEKLDQGYAKLLELIQLRLGTNK